MIEREYFQKKKDAKETSRHSKARRLRRGEGWGCKAWESWVCEGENQFEILNYFVVRRDNQKHGLFLGRQQ